MPATLIVGTQFGDEGKGKVTDFFAEKADLVVRYQGGNNAGHTVVAKGKKYKFHLLPSGLVQEKRCCLGAGLVIDPRVLMQEIEQIAGTHKVDIAIDPRAQIIMPWHNALDDAREGNLGKKKIGTTGRGIGPCYEDRANRSGIRFSELVDGKKLKERVSELFPLKKKVIEDVYSGKVGFSEDEVLKEYTGLGEKLGQYLSDVSLEVSKALEHGKSVIFEGAQGTFLDNDFGTYPFVTSSHPIAGGMYTGVGIGLLKEFEVVGIVKAYTTRVGSGPFVTELENELGDMIREQGQEFGTTTGRPRRVGWLDLVLLRTAHRLNGFTAIALTKLDVLSGIEELRICTAYEKGGKTLEEFPADWSELEGCSPVYETFQGFEIEPGTGSFEELPEGAQNYVKFIEEKLGLPITLIGTGPGREETITR